MGTRLGETCAQTSVTLKGLAGLKRADATAHTATGTAQTVVAVACRKL